MGSIFFGCLQFSPPKLVYTLQFSAYHIQKIFAALLPWTVSDHYANFGAVLILSSVTVFWLSFLVVFWSLIGIYLLCLLWKLSIFHYDSKCWMFFFVDRNLVKINSMLLAFMFHSCKNDISLWLFGFIPFCIKRKIVGKFIGWFTSFLFLFCHVTSVISYSDSMFHLCHFSHWNFDV